MEGIGPSPLPYECKAHSEKEGDRTKNIQEFKLVAIEERNDIPPETMSNLVTNYGERLMNDINMKDFELIIISIIMRHQFPTVRIILL